jgi:hypothetical protein
MQGLHHAWIEPACVQARENQAVLFNPLVGLKFSPTICELPALKQYRGKLKLLFVRIEKELVIPKLMSTRTLTGTSETGT